MIAIPGSLLVRPSRASAAVEVFAKTCSAGVSRLTRMVPFARRIHHGFPLATLAVWLGASTADAQWTVTNLHPANAVRSEAHGLWGGQQVGEVFDANGVMHASMWSGTAASWVDLDPAGNGSSALGASAGRQVGFLYVDPSTTHASLWSGTAASRVDLNPTGTEWTASQANAISGNQQVGQVSNDGGVNHASLWTGTAASWIDLSPVGAAPFTSSNALSIDAGREVGWATVNGSSHASLWSGTAASWVDLNPAGSLGSTAYGISGDQQAGSASFSGSPHAGIWHNTAASWLDLNPSGATVSVAFGTYSGWQAGYAAVGGKFRASLWNGSAASWQDLSLALPANWTTSIAESVWSDGTTLFVSGYARDVAAGRYEAMLWSRPIPEPGTGALIGLVALLAGRRRSRAHGSRATARSFRNRRFDVFATAWRRAPGDSLVLCHSHLVTVYRRG